MQRGFFRGAVSALVCLCLGGPAWADEGEGQQVRCERTQFAVALAPDQPADNTLVGFLCTRGGLDGKTIQVLLHGGSYDHNYWDFPFEPDTYSYVRSITRGGYAVLNVDRLGSGESTHPPSGIGLTLHVGAFTIHQVVQTLRSGALMVPGMGKVRPARVELVGHSLGSFVASIEASTYQDVDGVILSGNGHHVGPALTIVNNNLYPAVFDPKFATSGLAFDYLTTIPGTRGVDFYWLPGADPSVIALDEVLKQPVTIGELADIFPSFPATLGITVPTLVVLGEEDMIICSPPTCTQSGSLANETANYGPRACVEVNTIPGSGHDLNLHRVAPTWFELARDWSDRRVGPSAEEPPTQRCQP